VSSRSKNTAWRGIDIEAIDIEAIDIEALSFRKVPATHDDCETLSISQVVPSYWVTENV
jgi:hypothetical protein